MSFQVIKTWKQSTDPDFEAKKNRVLHLYDIADGKAKPGEGDPTVVICMDEFGPLNLLPRPGKQWAPMAVKTSRRARRPAPAAPAAGHLQPQRRGPPPDGRLRPEQGQALRPRQGDEEPHRRSSSSAATCGPSTRPTSASPSSWTTSARTSRPRSTPGWATGPRPTTSSWPTCPTNASWLNRIEAQFQALRYFTLDGTDHTSHDEQNSMIRRYIIWRNRNAHDKTLRELVKRANVA